MILKIVLFLSCCLLVSSNNGYPIIPAQIYPNYQQNGYANPTANQPNDIASYLQAMLVQNQSPSLNLSPSDIKQILLNKLLSGQQIQTNSDQNTRGYGSNFVEMPCNAMAMNGANSYFAPSMANEYKNNQRISTNKENKKEEIKTEEKHKKTKKRKVKRKHNESIKRHKSELDKEDDVQDNDRQLSKKSKKRPRKPKNSSSHENQSNNEKNKKNKKKKRKNKETEVKNPVEGDDKVEEPKQQRHHKKKKKSNKDNEEKVVSDQPKTLKSTQIQESINLDHFNEGIVEENRIPRNPVPESNDFIKPSSSLPENFASNFNLNGLSQFNNPAMSHFFANFENIYQGMMANKGTNESKEIKRNKRPQSAPKRGNNNRTKVAVKNKNSTSTATTVPKRPKPAIIPKVNVVTTEKTIQNKEKSRANNDPVPKDESPKSIEKTSEKKNTVEELENDEVKDIMEMNLNESDPNYGYIEDYYPQFTDSAAYTANNREVYVKNLSDTKYYYAVDKENPELLNRRRFEALVLPERIIKDYEVDKKYDVAEESIKTNKKPDFKEDVIQFRTPPRLEIPDFQTRQVHRNEINPDSNFLYDEIDDYDARFLPDKASSYSEVKIPHQRGTKDGNDKVVETVFARSKVATYGPVYIPENSDSASTSNQELTDDSYFKDGGTTYILAKSLDYP